MSVGELAWKLDNGNSSEKLEAAETLGCLKARNYYILGLLMRVIRGDADDLVKASAAASLAKVRYAMFGDNSDSVFEAGSIEQMLCAEVDEELLNVSIGIREQA